MEKRRLGNSDIQVAPLMFGGNVFRWTIDRERSFQLLDGFVDAGFDFIDTADVYSNWAPGNTGHDSERIIGEWFKQSGKRDKVILATKVGMDLGNGRSGLAKSYIMRAVEDSLQSLQTDYIDLYQSHRDDESVPLDETLEAYSELVKQGKVRVVGASNYGAERLKSALEISAEHGYPRYESLQPLYNLYDRQDYETNLEPVVLENTVGVIPYFSLASGFLTGKYRSEADLSKSKRGERVRRYLDDRGYKILAALDQVAKDCNATPGQIALAWLVARPSVTAPIASATDLGQLSDLVAGVKLTLDHSAIDLLNEASAY